MDANELKKMMSQMVGYMARHGLQRMKVKDGEFEIELEKPRQLDPQMMQQSAVQYALPSSPLAISETKPAAASLEGHLVTAPIVGTYYSSTTPGAPALVKLGDSVQEGTIICIIEAMKVMNEVRAGKSGKVAEIYLENGHPVEFGTKLLRIVQG